MHEKGHRFGLPQIHCLMVARASTVLRHQAGYRPQNTPWPARQTFRWCRLKTFRTSPAHPVAKAWKGTLMERTHKRTNKCPISIAFPQGLPLHGDNACFRFADPMLALSRRTRFIYRYWFFRWTRPVNRHIPHNVDHSSLEQVEKVH